MHRSARSPRGPPARARRLAELGLRAGQRVHVLQRSAGGGRLLGIGADRIAVGRATLRALPVVDEPVVDDATAVDGTP
ncbi:MAG TPA: ferrous iron transport protein A [Actinomycetes bacterium]